MKKILLNCFLLFAALPVFGKEGIAKTNGIEIWYETFGNEYDPALLLIMGGCTQGIMWPTEFCEKLSNEGFYVIRYDHRDMGYSTCFDFATNPYDLMDMSKDAVGLLDYLEIDQAHLFGLSMGGPISQLMSVRFPEKVLSIALIATSCEFRPFNVAYNSFLPEENDLPSPNDDYMEWLQSLIQNPPQNDEELLASRVFIWNLLNGKKFPMDQEKNIQLQKEFTSRLRCPQGLANHIEAINRSEDLIRTVSVKVNVPTVIFHGTEDPIFPPAHGIALASKIKGSTFLLVDGLGHVINSHFYDLLIENILINAEKAPLVCEDCSY